MNRNFFLSILKPLAPLYEDPLINEIQIRPNGSIWVERRGQIVPEKAFSIQPGVLEFALTALAGAGNYPLNSRFPKLDIRLEDGARVAILAPPIVSPGYAVTIRRFPQDFHLTELQTRRTVTADQAHLLREAIAERKTILISGSTRSGKTTLARALLNEIGSYSENIVLIEQPAELNLRGSDTRNIIPIEVRDENSNTPAFTATDALKAALRHSPERIIMGELRGGEAADFLEALNTGHPGSLTTIHANSAQDALTRLVTLARKGDPHVPRDVLIDSVARAIDVVCHITNRDGFRSVTEIVFVTGVTADRAEILTVPST